MYFEKKKQGVGIVQLIYKIHCIDRIFLDIIK